MFAASGGTDTSSDRDVTRPAMVRIWLVAAAALVVGILLGFATGFNAGRRAGESGDVGGASQDSPAQSPESGSTFSEGAVKEPVRVEPPPIVAEPRASPPDESKGASPAHEPKRANPPDELKERRRDPRRPPSAHPSRTRLRPDRGRSRWCHVLPAPRSSSTARASAVRRCRSPRFPMAPTTSASTCPASADGRPPCRSVPASRRASRRRWNNRDEMQNAEFRMQIARGSKLGGEGRCGVTSLRSQRHPVCILHSEF